MDSIAGYSGMVDLQQLTLRQTAQMKMSLGFGSETIGVGLVVIGSVERSLDSQKESGIGSSSVQRGEPFDSLRSLKALGLPDGRSESCFWGLRRTRGERP